MNKDVVKIQQVVIHSSSVFRLRRILAYVQESVFWATAFKKEKKNN